MTAEPSIVGREHWTRKGDVRLFLWEKAAGAAPGPRGTVLFVHGSSMASQPTFDLQVPGRSDSSAMDCFARLGYDTWCVDMEGYGRSDKHRDDQLGHRHRRRRSGGGHRVHRSNAGRRVVLDLWRVLRRLEGCPLRRAPPRARPAPGARRLRVDRAGKPDPGRAEQASARVPAPEPPSDRSRVRPEHLHARSSRDGRRRDDRGVRRRHPGPGRLGADRHLRRHVREPAGRRPGADHGADDRHAGAVRRHRELRGSAATSSRGCRTPTSSSPSCPVSRTRASSRRTTRSRTTSCTASSASPRRSTEAPDGEEDR